MFRSQCIVCPGSGWGLSPLLLRLIVPAADLSRHMVWRVSVCNWINRMPLRVLASLTLLLTATIAFGIDFGASVKSVGTVEGRQLCGLSIRGLLDQLFTAGTKWAAQGDR